MLYRLLAPILRLIVRIFYRRIEVHGREKIPHGIPLLFAANHPNTAMDPFMLALHHDRPVHFMAKSTLFRWPPMAWFLRSLGVIPVYRRMDGAGQTDRNRETFAECFAVLKRGESVGIFPEGTSLYVTRLLPIKTGAARIVLEAEANGFGLGVKIVPVGLNYLEQFTFRSDVLVLFGDPIDPSTVFERHRSDPAGAVDDLTERIETALTGLTKNLREGQDGRFVKRLSRIYEAGFLSSDPAGPSRNLHETFSVDRAIVEAYAHFSDVQPERTRRVQAEIERYLLLTEKLGLDEEVLEARKEPRRLVRALAVELPLLLLFGLPIAGWGLLTNWIPYRLTGPIADRMSVDLTEVATYKVAAGTVLYMVYYAILAVVFARLLTPVAAVAALLAAPVAGLATLELADRAALLWRHLRAEILSGRGSRRLARLEKLRDEILAELQALAMEWRSR